MYSFVQMEIIDMGGAFGEMMMAAIGGVVCFVVIKEIMNGQNTSNWYEEGLHDGQLSW